MRIHSDFFERVNLKGAKQSIYYSIYHPKEDVRATMLILHGMQEHSERYEETAKHFAERGIAVLVYDHLGHGRTAKSEKEIGFFLKNKGVQQLVEDARLMSELLKEQYPTSSHFILGHAMGSFITRLLLQDHSDNFKGAILVGSGGPIIGLSFAKTIIGVQNFFSPRNKRTRLNSVFTKIINRRFKNDKGSTTLSWLSASKENQEAFMADKLNGIPFTNNGYFTLAKLNLKATEKNWAKSIKKDFPMVFMSGIDDPIGGFSKGVVQTTSDLENQGFTEITTILYPKMRHEILNEEDRGLVFKDVVDWITEVKNNNQ